LPTPSRQRARVVPPTPITVAIDEVGTGACLCYAVVANVSESGACVWTNGVLARDEEYQLRVSFANPPEVHEITASVVWEDPVSPAAGLGMRRFGVRWRDVASPCVGRLRELASEVQAPSTPSGRMRAISRAELER
jgi:hypothetical protein